MPLHAPASDELAWMSQRRFELFVIVRNTIPSLARFTRETMAASQRIHAIARPDEINREAAERANRIACTLDLSKFALTGWLVDAIDPDVTDEALEADFPIDFFEDLDARVAGEASDAARVCAWLATHSTRPS